MAERLLTPALCLLTKLCVLSGGRLALFDCFQFFGAVRRPDFFFLQEPRRIEN